jgi:hypothetical protein
MAFSFQGGSDPSGGILTAARSENAITFERSQQPAFEAVRDELNRRLHGPSKLSIVPAPTAADRIRELGALREAGLVTVEEFESKKAEILSQL